MPFPAEGFTSHHDAGQVVLLGSRGIYEALLHRRGDAHLFWHKYTDSADEYALRFQASYPSMRARWEARNSSILWASTELDGRLPQRQDQFCDVLQVFEVIADHLLGGNTYT